RSSLISNSKKSESTSNWSRTKNFVAPQFGCQTMRSDSSFASKLKFSSVQFSLSCSPCVSTIQTNTSRPPIDHESVAQEADAYDGGRDCKMAGAVPATGAALRVFPDPAGQSPAV